MKIIECKVRNQTRVSNNLDHMVVETESCKCYEIPPNVIRSLQHAKTVVKGKSLNAKREIKQEFPIV